MGFEDQLSLNAGQKYCRMLQGEHSAILSTFVNLPFVIKTFVLYSFGCTFHTGFTVLNINSVHMAKMGPIAKNKYFFGRKIVKIFLPISFNIRFGCSKEPSH